MASIDYVSGTIQGKNIEEVLSYVSRFSEGWVSGRGSHGYKASWASPGFRIFYDGAAGMGVYVQVSGEGCSRVSAGTGFQTWGDWFGGWQEFGFETGRIDLAFDDRSGRLNVREMARKVEAGECTTKYRTHELKVGSRDGASVKEVLYIGTVESDTMLCVYDKRLEQMQRGASDPGEWVRVEMRFRNKAAEGLASWIVGNAELAGAEGFLSASFQFRDPSGDSRKDRWDVTPFWDEFLAECGKIRIQAVKPVRTLAQHVERFTRQHAATLAMLVLCMCAGRLKGDWLDSLVMTGWGRLNKEQSALVRQTIGHLPGTGVLLHT